MGEESERVKRHGRRKVGEARRLLRRFVRHGIQKNLFPKVICASDLASLMCLLFGLIRKGWAMWPAAVVFIVGHHIRDPDVFADWVRKAPSKLLYTAGAARWLRSLDIPDAKFWLGPATFVVGPDVIEKWLRPSHEGVLIAAGQALADILYGALKVDKAQEILQRLPHVKGYGHHILRAFGDAIALACHVKLYTDVPRSIVRSRFAAADAPRKMSQHVSVLCDLIQIETCSLEYPKEAKLAGKTGALTNGDRALVLCELSEMLGHIGVLPKLSSVSQNTSVAGYASGISLSGLRVLCSHFAKLQHPLRVQDLGQLSAARCEDAAVNRAFGRFLSKFKVPHYSVIALNMSSLIPAGVKNLVRQDPRGGQVSGGHLKRKLRFILKPAKRRRT